MIRAILPTIPLSPHGKLYLYLSFYPDLDLYRYLKAQAHADSDCEQYEASSQTTEQCDGNASPFHTASGRTLPVRCSRTYTERKPN